MEQVVLQDWGYSILEEETVQQSKEKLAFLIFSLERLLTDIQALVYRFESEDDYHNFKA